MMTRKRFITTKTKQVEIEDDEQDDFRKTFKDKTFSLFVHYKLLLLPDGRSH